MAKKREILELLTKRKLVEVSHHLGFRSWQVLSKGEIVNRLSRQRKKPTEEILDLLKINELRHICNELNLNSGVIFINKWSGPDQKSFRLPMGKYWKIKNEYTDLYPGPEPEAGRWQRVDKNYFK